MATTTANQGMPYPQSSDTPADTPLFIQNLAQALEKKLVQVFTTSTDRDTKLTSPTNGMFCVLTTPGEMYLRTGGAWVKTYPVDSHILSGTTTPSSGSGNNGDIYIKY